MNLNCSRVKDRHLKNSLLLLNPDVEANLFNTARYVNPDKILGYKQKGIEYSFLDDY